MKQMVSPVTECTIVQFNGNIVLFPSNKMALKHCFKYVFFDTVRFAFGQILKKKKKVINNTLYCKFKT